jgi:hypothetical protein
MCDPSHLEVASKVNTDSFGLEFAMPATVLTGFDPSECRRLGFAYLVRDHEHGSQTWSTRSKFLFQYDPSTWGTVELTG